MRGPLAISCRLLAKTESQRLRANSQKLLSSPVAAEEGPGGRPTVARTTYSEGAFFDLPRLRLLGLLVGAAALPAALVGGGGATSVSFLSAPAERSGRRS